MTIELFLEKIWSSKKWILAAMIFTFCGHQIFSCFSEIKKIGGEQFEFFSEIIDVEREQSRQNQVLDIYEQSVNDLGPLLDYYKSNVDSLNNIDPEIQKVGKQYATLTSERLRVLYASLEGIRLSCVECRDLQKELLTGVGLSVEIARGFVTYFDDPNLEGAKNKISNLYAEKMSRNLSIAATVIPGFTRELRKITVDMDKNIHKLRHAERLAYVMLACIIYEVLFFIICIWQYVKFRNNEKKSVQYQWMP